MRSKQNSQIAGLLIALSFIIPNETQAASRADRYQKSFTEIKKQVDIACTNQGRESQARVQVARSAEGSIERNLESIRGEITNINARLNVDPYRAQIGAIDQQINQLEKDAKQEAFTAAELRMIDPENEKVFSAAHEKSRQTGTTIEDLTVKKQELLDMPKGEIEQLRQSYRSGLTNELNAFVEVSDQFERLQTVTLGCKTRAGGAQPAIDVRASEAADREADLKSGRAGATEQGN